MDRQFISLSQSLLRCLTPIVVQNWTKKRIDGRTLNWRKASRSKRIHLLASSSRLGAYSNGNDFSWCRFSAYGKVAIHLSGTSTAFNSRSFIIPELAPVLNRPQPPHVSCFFQCSPFPPQRPSFLRTCTLYMNNECRHGDGSDDNVCV